MKQSARTIALQALLKIEEEQAYSNIVLDQLFRKNRLDRKERNLATELVYGTVQQLRLLDFHIQPFLKQKVGKLDPWLRQLLRMSLYQFMFLDRIPSRAVVHEAVELAKEFGHKGTQRLVNGVLRNYLRQEKASVASIADPVEKLAVATSHPSWMVKRWVKRFGLETTEAICRANNERPSLALRVNRLKTTKEEIKSRLKEEGFTVEDSQLYEQGLVLSGGGQIMESPLFTEGFVTIQDESSMLIAPLVDPKPGMKVLDVCAAPGGKTTHMAELMNNEGLIISNDVYAHKEKLIHRAVQRLQITNVETRVEDALHLFDEERESALETFDRILVDAPCTGFGVIRRKPDLKWNKKREDIETIARLQYDILHRVSEWLKPGGQLVYSTCTFEEVENEYIQRKFIENHPQFKVVEGSTQQILPHQFQTDGFFLTKFEKSIEM